ncbi:hypothetical protein EMCG_03299 [[Emmonsia] crescens]|uniref:HNH nuclease domain-containing protein n=1 Tax=[Emmonsia] crescens TaxID=73230 RepID=A0A0G2HVI7_9EURO|nr:hypothetical protein EMCG_03299 [Emmonsia crescens UAMH 3008]
MSPINRMLLALVFLIQISLSNSYYLNLRMCGEGPGKGPGGRVRVGQYIRRRVGTALISELIRSAQNRMRDLEALLDTFYDDDDIIIGMQRSTQYTYEALFGTVYWGPQDENFVKNFEGRERFNYVKARLAKLQEMALGNARLQLWCTDDFITTRFPSRIDIDTLPPNAFWDDRTTDSGGQEMIVLDRAAKCNVDAVVGNKAFTVTSRPGNERIGTMILCPQNLYVGDPISRELPPLAEFHKVRTTVFPNEYAIDTVVHRNIIFLFLSMLSRLELDGNEPTISIAPPPVAGRHLFGWEAAAMLPMIHPKEALDNAALALDKNDWSTGTAVPMLPAEMGFTHFFQSINWAYEQLTRQGDPEHPPEMDWVVD